MTHSITMVCGLKVSPSTCSPDEANKANSQNVVVLRTGKIHNSKRTVLKQNDNYHAMIIVLLLSTLLSKATK